MTTPGPDQLGRSLVVASGDALPPAWENAAIVRIDDGVLGDQDRLAALVAEAQRAYYSRTRTVFHLMVDPVAFGQPASTDAPPYVLGPDFTFLTERLQKLVWHNSYDLRSGQPVWWWAHKAADRLGMSVAGPADVVDADGKPFWIDGGPRQPLSLDHAVIHHDTVDLGRSTTVPAPSEPTADLAADQLEAVAHGAGPARVIAPAGSGKTRVLTARFLHLRDARRYEPETLTALAYNRRAADEMSSRVHGAMRGSIRTIHSLGWEILRMAQPGVRLIDEAEQRQRIEPLASAPPRINTDVIGPYVEALDEVRVALREPDHVEAERDDIPGFTDLFVRYRSGLRDRNEADHSEQIYGAIEALLANPDLRAHFQDRCRHLLVDEFQDLTPAYLLLIRLVASPGLDVFGVGDDDQVIYGYSGADPSYLIEFDALFPGGGKHALEVNYRCPSDVVEAASTVLSYNHRRVDKVIRPNSTSEGLTVVRRAGDGLATASADVIEELIAADTTPDQIAVLARVNSALLPLHVALSVRGLAFNSPLTPRVLDRTVIRATLAWIRIALDPNAMRRNDLFEAVRRPQRGLTRLLGDLLGRRRGPFSLNTLIEAGADLEGKRGQRWDRFCEDILTVSRATDTTARLLDVLATDIGLERAAAALDDGRARADRAGQGDDLTALLRVGSMAPPPAEFEGWLREHMSPRPDSDGVMLSTVHRVKGLEWDHVIVFGVDEGAMPHSLADDIEEERRIFHVALTRGRNSVTVIADARRQSRFLSELDGSAPHTAPQPAVSRRAPEIDDGVFVGVGDLLGLAGGYEGEVREVLTTGVLVRLATGASMAVPWGERVTKGGSAGRLAPGEAPVDEDIADRIRQWRRQQASDQGVPAYVVFNDRTLEALAAMRPTTEEALLAVPGIGPAKLEAYGDELLDLLG